MIRTVVASSVLAAAFLLSAAPAKADWLCGPDQCVWVEYDVVEPALCSNLGTAGQTELFLEARYFRSMEDDLSVITSSISRIWNQTAGRSERQGQA